MADRTNLRIALARHLGQELTPRTALSIEAYAFGGSDLPCNGITTDVCRVVDFMAELTPVSLSSGMTGIGQVEDGQITGGMLFESFNGHSAWAHIAILPGHSFSRRGVVAANRYISEQLGNCQLLGKVDSSNARCVAMHERLGSELIARITGAGLAGCDLLIYKAHLLGLRP